MKVDSYVVMENGECRCLWNTIINTQNNYKDM